MLALFALVTSLNKIMSEQGRIGQPHLAKQDLSTLVTYCCTNWPVRLVKPKNRAVPARPGYVKLAMPKNRPVPARPGDINFVIRD